MNRKSGFVNNGHANRTQGGQQEKMVDEGDLDFSSYGFHEVPNPLKDGKRKSKMKIDPKGFSIDLEIEKTTSRIKEVEMKEKGDKLDESRTQIDERNERIREENFKKFKEQQMLMEDEDEIADEGYITPPNLSNPASSMTPPAITPKYAEMKKRRVREFSRRNTGRILSNTDVFFWN